jgi:hypothetical protein
MYALVEFFHEALPAWRDNAHFHPGKKSSHTVKMRKREEYLMCKNDCTNNLIEILL